MAKGYWVACRCVKREGYKPYAREQPFISQVGAKF